MTSWALYGSAVTDYRSSLQDCLHSFVPKKAFRIIALFTIGQNQPGRDFRRFNVKKRKRKKLKLQRRQAGVTAD